MRTQATRPLTTSDHAPGGNRDGGDTVTTHLRGLSAMGEIEVKMGLEPIENLLDDRNALVERTAVLRAKYGPFGVWEHLRKIELARLKALRRAQYQDQRVRASNDRIDDEAHQHPDYVEFVALALRERAEWNKLEERIAAIDFVLNRQQVVARYVTAEARL